VRSIVMSAERSGRSGAAEDTCKAGAIGENAVSISISIRKLEQGRNHSHIFHSYRVNEKLPLQDGGNRDPRVADE